MSATTIEVLEARVSALEARIRAIESTGDLPPSWSFERCVSKFEKDTLRMLDWLEGWVSRWQPYGHSKVTAREAWDELQDEFQGQLTPQDQLEKLKRLAEYRKLWIQS